MKERVLMMGVLLLTGVACSQRQMYEIRGTISGAEEGIPIELTGPSVEGEDSLLVTGKVTGSGFGISIDEGCEMACLRLPATKRKIPIFFEPQIRNYRIDIDTTGKSRIKGGALQEIWDEYETRRFEFGRRKRAVEAGYRESCRQDNLFGKMHLRAVYADLEAAQEQFEDSLLRANDNIVAAAIVWLRSRELAAGHRIGEKVALLGPNALQTAPGRAVKRIADLETRTKIGNIAPDFTQQDPDGEPIRLYAIQAKVKILDFWASWCAPCRAETPNVRSIYEKYKDAGLEIISVSLDTKRENWVQTIISDRMTWLHTSDLQGWENAVAKLYGVRSVPSIFVLDEENRIIGQDLRGKELEEVVEKILRK